MYCRSVALPISEIVMQIVLRNIRSRTYVGTFVRMCMSDEEFFEAFTEKNI